MYTGILMVMTITSNCQTTTYFYFVNLYDKLFPGVVHSS